MCGLTKQWHARQAAALHVILHYLFGSVSDVALLLARLLLAGQSTGRRRVSIASDARIGGGGSVQQGTAQYHVQAPGINREEGVQGTANDPHTGGAHL